MKPLDDMRNDGAMTHQQAERERLLCRIEDLEDLARNVGGFDDSLLKSADLNVIRATMREWRDEARRLLGADRKAALLEAARAVCWYDCSDSDPDFQEAVETLRKLVQ
jgi:hypothetical protein